MSAQHIFFFYWIGSDPVQPFQSRPELVRPSKRWRNSPLFKQTVEQQKEKKDEDGRGGEGWGEANLVVGLTMVLTVALVVLLPNEVIVHWGAASLAGGSSSSSLCVFFVSFFSSLLCFLFFFLFICPRPLLHLCFSPFFIPCFLPFLFFSSLFIL